MASEPQTPPGSELPPSVRAIHRLRDSLARHQTTVLLATAVAFGLATLASGFYTVESDETAAVLRFGALVDDSAQPGLRFRWPGVDRVVKARTGEVSRLEIRGDDGLTLSMVTGDENLIEAELVVQYRIGSVEDFLFGTEDPAALVEQMVRSALVESFAVTAVDEVLTSAKAAIQNTVRSDAQQRLDACGSGITLVAVSLQAVNPPREAAGAFRAVSDARAEAAKSINRAKGERDRQLRLTRGQADRALTEARSFADARKSQAEGAAERFESLLVRARVSPRQTRNELYTSTLRTVLPPVQLIVLAPGERPRITLELLPEGKRRGGIPPGRSMDDR